MPEGGSVVHGDVHQASFSSHLCSRLPGDQNSSTQEQRPDVAPQGHVGNEYKKKKNSVFFKTFFIISFN